MSQPQTTNILSNSTMPLLIQNSIHEKTIETVLKNDEQTKQEISDKKLKEDLKAEILIEQERIKMESEKTYLQETLDTIKDKHNVELDYLEESYK